MTPVADLREVAAHGLGERLPAADAPAERPIELRHAGRQHLEHEPCSPAPRSTGQTHQVLGEPHPAEFRQRPDPHHAVDRDRDRAVSDLPLGQVDVADDLAVDLGQQPLIGPIDRVAQGAQERLAIRAVKDMEQRLIDRLMIGFGAEAILDRTAAKWQATSGAEAFIGSTIVWVHAARGGALCRSPGVSFA